MNGLDVVIVIVLVLAAVSGYRRGAALQVFAYGGLLLGLVVGALIAPRLATTAESHAAQAGIAVTTLLLAGAAGDAAGLLIGSRMRARPGLALRVLWDLFRIPLIHRRLPAPPTRS